MNYRCTMAIWHEGICAIAVSDFPFLWNTQLNKQLSKPNHTDYLISEFSVTKVLYDLE